MIILRIFVLFLVLCYSLPANAETQEWKDKNYTFSSQKRIYVVYSTPNNINEISEHEISDMMYDKLMPMAKSLNQLGYSVFNQADIVENLKREKNIDLPELYKTNPTECNNLVKDYIHKNSDIILSIDVLYYNTGTEYQEGHYNFITDNYAGTVTPYYVQGGNVPVAYACVQFNVQDTKTGKNVWIRKDDRGRANRDILSHTKPKDLLRRILKRYFSDAHKVFTGKGLSDDEE